MKILFKTLIAATLLSVLAACGSQKTNQGNTSADSSSSSPSSPAATSSAETPSPSDSTKATNLSTANATKVDATLKEMSIELSQTTVPAGPVQFVVKNAGKVPHEFVVLKNDLTDKKLPMKGDKLDEDAKGLKNMGEIGEDKLKSGVTETLNANLTPGKYLIVCNVQNHFKRGMKTELTVK